MSVPLYRKPTPRTRAGKAARNACLEGVRSLLLVLPPNEIKRLWSQMAGRDVPSFLKVRKGHLLAREASLFKKAYAASKKADDE